MHRVGRRFLMTIICHEGKHLGIDAFILLAFTNIIILA